MKLLLRNKAVDCTFEAVFLVFFECTLLLLCSAVVLSGRTAVPVPARRGQNLPFACTLLPLPY